MYQNLYNLLLNGIYGVVELTPDMELTLTLLSTVGCVFMVALPFLMIYKIIKLL